MLSWTCHLIELFLGFQKIIMPLKLDAPSPSYDQSKELRYNYTLLYNHVTHVLWSQDCFCYTRIKHTLPSTPPAPRSHGDTASCRKVLQRASNSASDDPEMVCEALLQFERESGDLESFEGALVRCEAQLDRVRARREKVCVCVCVCVCGQ